MSEAFLHFADPPFYSASVARLAMGELLFGKLVFTSMTLQKQLQLANPALPF